MPVAMRSKSPARNRARRNQNKNRDVMPPFGRARARSKVFWMQIGSSGSHSMSAGAPTASGSPPSTIKMSPSTTLYRASASSEKSMDFRSWKSTAPSRRLAALRYRTGRAPVEYCGASWRPSSKSATSVIGCQRLFDSKRFSASSRITRSSSAAVRTTSSRHSPCLSTNFATRTTSRCTEIGGRRNSWTARTPQLSLVTAIRRRYRGRADGTLRFEGSTEETRAGTHWDGP